MSAPIYSCLLAKACTDEASYQDLLQKYRWNKECGHWTQFPCTCESPCPIPTDEQMKTLNERLANDSKDVVFAGGVLDV